MTWITHKRYSVSFAFIASVILEIMGMTEINYWLGLLLILSMSKVGALFPDIDHNWQSVKMKNFVTYILNRIIHLTGGKHRCWQTHSLDIAVYATVASYMVPNMLYDKMIISLIDKELLFIVCVGFCSGWLSHLFSDALTSGGIRIFCFIPKKFAFVPKKIFKFRFNTGAEWERFCFKVTGIINTILGIVSITFPIYYPYIIKYLL